MDKKIDGYIEKIGDDYNMYFHYNGVEFCFLYKDEKAKIQGQGRLWLCFLGDPLSRRYFNKHLS